MSWVVAGELIPVNITESELALGHAFTPPTIVGSAFSDGDEEESVILSGAVMRL